MTISASFSNDPSVTRVGDAGQLAHHDHIDHGARFERRLYSVRDGVWCLVGNGLSNQTFVEGPEGLIVIDTGECVEEMASALSEVRAVTDAPIAAVIYTHFHYVAGTKALSVEVDVDTLRIWGHEGIVGNRRRTSSEVSAAFGRGLVHQFGIMLPDQGPDALVNVGLGTSFRNGSHAPFTPGFVEPTHTFDGSAEATIAGLRVEMTHAPSDADDSITIWFPDLDLCVNNLVWPALFNVFAIRGEEYRDPRILLAGLDHLRSLEPEHCVGAHGPPLSGRKAVADELTVYRDSIQFMWDQTVRALNKGLLAGELIEAVQLPDCFGQSHLTRQYYGLVEHHVRQIRNALVGWFDGSEPDLFPLPPVERATRLIEGFGGREAVRATAEAALADDELRWALELASWLVRSELAPDGRADGGTAEERGVLASVLRAIAQRTTSANVRNWCLTRALELDGTIDLWRFRTHRFSARDVAAGEPAATVRTLRVLLDPDRATGLDEHLAWRFADGQTVGLHVRNCVAAPTDGSGAELVLELDLDTWALILGGRETLESQVASGAVNIVGDRDRTAAVLGCFDLEGLHLLSVPA